MIIETNITNLLDTKGINYKLLPHTIPVFTCEDAAKERKVPMDEMIKCILLVDKGKKYYLACLTSDKKLNPQKARELVGCSRLSFAQKKDIEEVLGYQLGAIPPLLLKVTIPILFDNTILKKEKVNISSGNPLAGIELDSKTLINLVKLYLVGDISD